MKLKKENKICQCEHNKISHHSLEGERTWCYNCECIEFRKFQKKMKRFCYYCKKPMYSSNENIWIKNKNYDIHKKCKGENEILSCPKGQSI